MTEADKPGIAPKSEAKFVPLNLVELWKEAGRADASMIEIRCPDGMSEEMFTRTAQEMVANWWYKREGFLGTSYVEEDKPPARPDFYALHTHGHPIAWVQSVDQYPTITVLGRMSEDEQIKQFGKKLPFAIATPKRRMSIIAKAFNAAGQRIPW